MLCNYNRRENLFAWIEHYWTGLVWVSFRSKIWKCGKPCQISVCWSIRWHRNLWPIICRKILRLNTQICIREARVESADWMNMGWWPEDYANSTAIKLSVHWRTNINIGQMEISKVEKTFSVEDRQSGREKNWRCGIQNLIHFFVVRNV